MKMQVESFDICVDCFETLFCEPVDEARDRLIEGRVQWFFKEIGANVHHYHWSDSGRVNEFSWAPCALCLSELGGQRFEVDLVMFEE
jgi:hypothetical protein